MYICICAYVYIWIYGYMYICICVYICMYVYVYIYIYIREIPVKCDFCSQPFVNCPEYTPKEMGKWDYRMTRGYIHTMGRQRTPKGCNHGSQIQTSINIHNGYIKDVIGYNLESIVFFLDVYTPKLWPFTTENDNKSMDRPGASSPSYWYGYLMWGK